jgi:PadR family transcriptional regulator AphA
MRSTNAYALLCLLSIQPMNGYTMKQWVDNLLSHFWKTSYGQIYPTMEKFLDEGLVDVEKRESQTAPSSKYYHITDKGLNELKGWLMEDTLDFNQRDESLLKFYFSNLLPLDTVLEKFERSLTAQQELLDKYNCDSQRMVGEVPDPTIEQMMEYLSTKKGIYLNEARIKWMNDCIEDLKWFREKENKKQGNSKKE